MSVTQSFAQQKRWRSEVIAELCVAKSTVDALKALDEW